MKLWTDPIPDEVFGGFFEMGTELDLLDLMKDHVLLQNLAFDDLGGFFSELELAARDQPLPFPEENADRLARVKEHLYGDPIGEPADGCSDKGSQNDEEHRFLRGRLRVVRFELGCEIDGFKLKVQPADSPHAKWALL